MTVLAIAITAGAALAHAEPPDAKDPGTARYLSALAGVAGTTLVVGGHDDGGPLVAGTIVLLVGPSAGHWYAGNVFTTGLGIRAAGLLTAGVGIDLVAGCDTEPGCSTTPGYALVVTGGGLMIGGAIWDTVTAGDAVRDWNDRHHVRVVPTLTGGVPGLAIAGRF